MIDEIIEYNDKISKKLDVASKAIREAEELKENRAKLIYNWIKKHHPSWLKHACMNGLEDPTYRDNIIINMREVENGKVYISVLTYDAKADPDAYYSESYWSTHKVNVNELK